MQRVLIIDDSLTIRKLVEFALSAGPYQLTSVDNGRDGLAAIARVKPDIILLDYVLPDLNGAQLLAELDDDLRHIPVIIMTAKDPSVRSQFSAYAQVRFFLSKPFSQEQLRQQLHALAPQAANPDDDSLVDGQQERFAQQRLLAEQLYRSFEADLQRCVRLWRDQGLPNTAAGLAKSLLTPQAMEKILTTAETKPEVFGVLPDDASGATDAGTDKANFEW